MEPKMKGCGCSGSGVGAASASIGSLSKPIAHQPPPKQPDIPRMRLSQQSQSQSQQQQQPQSQACMIQPTASGDDDDEEQMSDRLKEKLEKEAKEAELARWVSPLRQFDVFANSELRRRDQLEEDFPKLKVPQLKGHHRCRVSCLLNHNVDYAVDMEQELRNIGIQETQMMDMLEKLTRAEAAVRFQGAVRAAEVAAMSAPPELAEEAAVAGARGYTVETQEFSKSSKPGENPIEIVGYIGCTRPNNF